MPTNFPPPVNVSPLIRFGRYSLLLAGIGYGAFWQSRYTKKELGLKDIKAREKAARDERLAKEKALRNADPETKGLNASSLSVNSENGEEQRQGFEEADGPVSNDIVEENNQKDNPVDVVLETTNQLESESEHSLSDVQNKNLEDKSADDWFNIGRKPTATESKYEVLDSTRNYEWEFENFMFAHGSI